MSTFILRGPVPPSSSMFYGRQSELAELTGLCEEDVRAYAIVYGARQTGKSSLLLRLQHNLPTEVAHTCLVNFQEIPRADSKTTYAFITTTVSRCLQAPDRPVHDSVQFGQALSDIIGQLGDKKLVLLFEELGALLPETRFDLANVLRASFTNRHTRPNLDRLMVIIAGSIEMYDLALASKDLSPLNNISEPIYLPDLGQTDAVVLVEHGLVRLGVEQKNARHLGELIYGHVAGYPYFTQHLAGQLEKELGRGQTLSGEHVEKAVDHTLVDNSLLQHMYNTLKEEELFESARELIEKKIRFSRVDGEMARLELIGLARKSGDYWQVRNSLFERALRGWLENAPKEMAEPETRPHITVVGNGNIVGDGNTNIEEIRNSTGVTIGDNSSTQIDQSQVKTEGGAIIEGDVEAGGDFVGRDQENFASTGNEKE